MRLRIAERFGLDPTEFNPSAGWEPILTAYERIRQHEERVQREEVLRWLIS